MVRRERVPILQRGDLGWLAVIAFLALSFFFAALAAKLGGFLMKRTITLAAIGAAALALSACGTLQLTGNPAADAKAAAANVGAATNPQQFVANLKAFNEALGQVCAGYGNLDWNPPLPPTGSLHAQCAFGKQPPATFGNMPGALVGPNPAGASPASPQ